jgi:hypothetical protein
MNSSYQNWDENFTTVNSKETFRVGECTQVELPNTEQRVSVSWTLMQHRSQLQVFLYLA